MLYRKRERKKNSQSISPLVGAWKCSHQRLHLAHRHCRALMEESKHELTMYVCVVCVWERETERERERISHHHSVHIHKEDLQSRLSWQMRTHWVAGDLQNLTRVCLSFPFPPFFFISLSSPLLFSKSQEKGVSGCSFLVNNENWEGRFLCGKKDTDLTVGTITKLFAVRSKKTWSRDNKIKKERDDTSEGK